MSMKLEKFELYSAGVQALLKSPEMKGILGDLAGSRANSAPGNLKVDVKDYQRRSAANIYPADAKTRNSALKHNTLVKMVK